MISWLTGVWSRTHVVRILDGGEDAGPLADRATLAELRIPSTIEAARKLTTTGRFTENICRCPGDTTIALHDDSDELVAAASLHGYGNISWERHRLHNDLHVADPVALHLLLATHGVPDQIPLFLAPLTDLLNLHEGHPQFRPSGDAGRQHLTERAVPHVLHPALLPLTGQQAGELSTAQLEAMNNQLATATPSPVDRAGILLSWLGRLPVPAEAYWGEGALIRHLLADIPRADIATAARHTPTAHTAMGVVNLALHSGDDGTLTTAIRPTLRRLLSVAPMPPRSR
ncbi:hypothetical protein ACN265_19160 [Micromonospora sp. WMMD730]|uniref:hypothetical protein n=1 Tax=Micromonospora sp. WMMD730 TaxID=3404128 RepID=UPI003B948CDD